MEALYQLSYSPVRKSNSTVGRVACKIGGHAATSDDPVTGSRIRRRERGSG